MSAAESTELLRPLFDRERRWTREEYRQILSSLPAGFCPFCKYSETQYVLREFEQWVWIECRSAYWPYHTLVIPKRHFSASFEMNPDESVEFPQVERYVSQMYQENHLETMVLSLRRLRETPNGRLAHFHQHFAPEFEGMLDPILVRDANQWDRTVFLPEAVIEH